jgi:hypothetical protein
MHLQYPFNTLEEMILTDFRIEFNKGSIIRDLLALSKEESTFKKMWINVK